MGASPSRCVEALSVNRTGLAPMHSNLSKCRFAYIARVYCPDRRPIMLKIGVTRDLSERLSNFSTSLLGVKFVAKFECKNPVLLERMIKRTITINFMMAKGEWVKYSKEREKHLIEEAKQYLAIINHLKIRKTHTDIRTTLQCVMHRNRKTIKLLAFESGISLKNARSVLSIGTHDRETRRLIDKWIAGLEN